VFYSLKASFFFLLSIFILSTHFSASAQKKVAKSLSPYPKFDFSLAGYHLGKELPSRNPAGLNIFRVEDFGAKPDDGKDDIVAIQNAVDAAEKTGGGIVIFPAGVFDFDVETSQNFVRISSSNIVLRGYGEGIDGTILHDHKPSHSPDSNEKWRGGTYPSFFKVGRPVSNLDSLPVANLEDAAFGSKVLKVSGKVTVFPGTYALVQTNPADTSLTKELVFPLRKIGESHIKNEVKFAQMVRVLTSQNGVLTLDAPINWRLLQRWKPRLVRLPFLIEEVGIENFKMVCDWKETFFHHKSDIHDSGWDQIHFYGVENGWVRNIVHDSPSLAVAFSWCKNSVVYDCQIIGNRGHNGFQLNGGSTSNLLFNLKGGSAMHTYSLNNFCSGNVFHLCFTDAPSAVDCHGSLCIYNLFDNIYGAGVQNGGNNSVVPPVHAFGLVLYNFNAGHENAYNNRITSNLLKVSNYPGIHIYGLRSMLGFDISVEDETGHKQFTDFETPFAKVGRINTSGRMEIPSLYQWQRQQRYQNLLPEESLKSK